VEVQSLSGNAAMVRTTVGSHTAEVPLAKTAAGWLITKEVSPQGSPRELPRERVQAPRSEAPPMLTPETFQAFEEQLRGGQIKEATINKQSAKCTCR
jgi:hypothetical protein